jgi:hypothetical protein
MINHIRTLINERKYIATLHARTRMDERGIFTEDLVNLISEGDNRRISRKPAMSFGSDDGYCSRELLSRGYSSMQKPLENNHSLLARRG